MGQGSRLQIPYTPPAWLTNEQPSDPYWLQVARRAAKLVGVGDPVSTGMGIAGAPIEVPGGGTPLKALTEVVQRGGDTVKTAAKRAAKKSADLIGLSEVVTGAEQQIGALAKQLAGRTWYHGSGANVDPATLRPPTFLTTDKDAAEWYVQNRGDTGHGGVHAFPVSVKHPLPINSYEDAQHLANILNDAGVPVTLTNDAKYGWTWQADRVREVSPYSGDNPVDILYLPEAREAIRKAGYDAVYVAGDPFMNGEIEALVPLHPPGRGGHQR